MLCKSYKSSRKNDSPRMRKLVINRSYKPSMDGGDDGTRTRAYSYITSHSSIKSMCYKRGHWAIIPRISLILPIHVNFRSLFLGGIR
jgi:hypothetical protein